MITIVLYLNADFMSAPLFNVRFFQRVVAVLCSIASPLVFHMFPYAEEAISPLSAVGLASKGVISM